MEERHTEADRKPLTAGGGQRYQDLIFPLIELRAGIGLSEGMPVPFVGEVWNGHLANHPLAERSPSHRSNNAGANKGADKGEVAHAASPDLRMKSACHAENGTKPPVAASIARAVSASGNLSPFAYREIDACCLPMASANSTCLLSDRASQPLRCC